MKNLKAKIISMIPAIVTWFFNWTWKLDEKIGIRYDKLRHFFVGMAIYIIPFVGLAVIFALVSLIGGMYWSAALTLMHVISFGAVVLAAFWKEDKDRYEGRKFDWMDILATVLGGIAAMVIIDIGIYLFTLYF